MATKITMEGQHIDLSVDRVPPKNAANLIQCDVDMRVIVSSVKKSKMFQRFCAAVMFFLAILFAVMLYHLRREIRALQLQVQSLNVNLSLVTSKYDRLNQDWIQRCGRLLENRKLDDVKRLLEEASSMSKTTDVIGIRNKINDDAANPYGDSTKNSRDGHASRNDAYGINNGNNVAASKLLAALISNEDDRANGNPRVERAALEKENLTEGAIQGKIDNVNDDYYSDDGGDDDDDDGNDSDNDNDLDIWRESHSGRSKREEGRGKKRAKNKRQPKRSHRRLGPLVATFVGAIPEQHITDTVYIGPWVKSIRNNTQYNLNKFHLVEDKKSIEVTVTGLYMISAQIFYFGERINYSYWILLSSEGKSSTQKLVKCSTASSPSATEVSCYTSIITPLQRGDRVHIQQQEKDRLINMREGYSYIQLVLLSNNVRKKRFTIN
ncbi:uncharacterized protein LOC122538940 isoform X1 [Frieseomelitta varia]|uniref:uncharacterized protein LOC122538940 isoform X1 n=1 Tax=Frieseomelitta varia TaxID=561572 RepID=UPI001CB698C1|nr:uncharacterized protein LOC122538940 isoform X1 [Frieseomelitta varia]XP_043529390.1 uncharacterized protein LOC122538940 isoform X1 [Frieseomelitta varia]